MCFTSKIFFLFFFFNDTATPEIYPLSLHAALPISINVNANISSANASFAGTATANGSVAGTTQGQFFGANAATLAGIATFSGNSQYDTAFGGRSEEHTSELQSQSNLVCRLLLEKKK